MKVVLVAGAFVSALALSACGMLGGEGPPADTLAAKAPAALPPPVAASPSAAVAPPVAPEPEDLKPIPADQVKCIPPYVLKTTQKDGETDARCVAPSEVSGTPK
jgi:hypothetical protein